MDPTQGQADEMKGGIIDANRLLSQILVLARDSFVKNVHKGEQTNNLQPRYQRALKRSEDSKISLGWKEGGEELCRIRCGGTWKRKGLMFANLEILEEPLFVSTSHALPGGRQAMAHQ